MKRTCRTRRLSASLAPADAIYSGVAFCSMFTSSHRPINFINFINFINCSDGINVTSLFYKNKAICRLVINFFELVPSKLSVSVFKFLYYLAANANEGQRVKGDGRRAMSSLWRSNDRARQSAVFRRQRAKKNRWKSAHTGWYRLNHLYSRHPMKGWNAQRVGKWCGDFVSLKVLTLVISQHI